MQFLNFKNIQKSPKLKDLVPGHLLIDEFRRNQLLMYVGIVGDEFIFIVSPGHDGDLTPGVVKYDSHLIKPEFSIEQNAFKLI